MRSFSYVKSPFFVRTSAIPWLMFLLAMACSVHAEGLPEVDVESETSDIYLGESLRYQVSVKNLETPSAPQMGDFAPDFTVENLGDHSQNSQFISIVNGDVVKNVVYAHIYDYKITPKRAGQLVIPGPFVTANGGKIQGRALPLLVRAQEKQDNIIVELTSSKQRVYPTQPFDVIARVLIKPLPGTDRDPISLLNPVDLGITWLNAPEGLTTNEITSWLNNRLANDLHGFAIPGVTRGGSGFFAFEQQRAILNLYKGREMRTGMGGTQINYYVYELPRTFTAQKIGSFTFGPLTLKGVFVDGVQGQRYTTHRMVISAPAITVEVRDVPAPVPPTYCGGIGAYKVSASASPMTLRVGDPLTLKIDIERQPGSGSLSLVSAPNIGSIPELANDFEIIDKSPLGQTDGEKKTFSYPLRPKRAGVQIPALSVTTFNTENEQFIQTATQPIALTVSQAAQLNGQDLVASSINQKTNIIKNREGGLFQNFADMTALQDQRTNPAIFAITAAAFWLFYGLLAIWITRVRARAGDLVWQRKSRARPEAEHNVREARSALSNGQSTEAIKSVRAAIVGLIGNMLNIPAAGMTSYDAGAALANAGVSESYRNEVVQVLETIESMEYAPAGPQDAGILIARTEKLIPALQQELA